jgi:hypothetical protein
MPRLGRLYSGAVVQYCKLPLPNRRWQIANFVPSLVQKPRLTFEYLQYLYTSINQAVSISRLCMHCAENVTITVEQISISILSLFSKPPAYPF